MQRGLEKIPEVKGASKEAKLVILSHFAKGLVR